MTRRRSRRMARRTEEQEQDRGAGGIGG